MLHSQEFAQLTVVHSSSSFEILRGTFVRQRFAPHLHDTYAIGVMEGGAARCKSRGTESTHTPGDLITIEPGEVHTGESLTATGWSYRMLYVPRDIMTRADAHGRLPRFATACVHDPELASRLARVHALLEQQADPLREESALISALHAICARHAQHAQHAQPGADDEPCASPPGIRRVRELIDVHFAERLCLADLATLAAMSPFHLIRLFRRHYGVPPHRYLELVRVEHARRMLQGGASISEIAFATGFSDQSHLTRHFKRVLGVTPGSYSRSYGSRAKS